MKKIEFQFGRYRIRVAESLLDTAIFSEWYSVCEGSSHLSPEKLLAIERSQPEDLSFRYILVYIDHEPIPIGIAYLQVLKFSHRNFRFAKSNITGQIITFLLRFLPFRVYMMGNLFAVDFQAFSFNEHHIERLKFLGLINEYLRNEKYDIWVLKDIDLPIEDKEIELLGLTKFKADLAMMLSIRKEWKKFSDYLSSLTHRYRQRARRILKDGELLERRQISNELFHENRNRIKQLFKQVVEKQTVSMGIVDEKYFEELEKVYTSNFEMIGYFKTGELVAFATYINHPEKLEVHYIGIDYTYNSKYYLYFNILFDGVRKAIELQKQFLELGRTAREAKAIIGCEPVRFNDYVKCRNSAARWLLDKLQNYFLSRMGDSWQSRHPFKKSGETISYGK